MKDEVTEKTIMEKFEALQEVDLRHDPSFNVAIKVTPMVYTLTHFLFPSWDAPEIQQIWLPKAMAEIMTWIDGQPTHHKFLLAWINLTKK
jgi:hypothetical protein